jgi:hypothetical protein
MGRFEKEIYYTAHDAGLPSTVVVALPKHDSPPSARRQIITREEKPPRSSRQIPPLGRYRKLRHDLNYARSASE